MKIGILTHRLGTNYGGLLQNFALQEVLINLGHDPITLNHYPKSAYPWYIKIASVCIRIFRKLKGEKVTLKAWTTQEEQKQISKYTDEFISKYINTTEPFRLSEIGRFKHSFDAIFVGSDQVWNPHYMKPIERFFLSDFTDVNVPKIAYAASFGGESWLFSNIETIHCKELVSQFKAVSVRENTGVSMCDKYLDCKAEFVLDPTLLVTIDCYIKLIQKSNLSPLSGKTMMTYLLDKSKEKQIIVQRLSNELSLNINSVMPQKSIGESGKTNIEDCVFPSVEEWLRGFLDADFVVTDSFHGTVFSLIFNKPFVTILNKKRGADRFTSLLGYLNLEDRLVTNVEAAEAVINKPIDYCMVNDKLNLLRESSINFIKYNLE